MLEPLLSVRARGRKARVLRRQVDGIRFRLRTGCPWRDVPEDRLSQIRLLLRRFDRCG
ncbi:transposase [Xylanimonas allomyrinae]|uniref:transposase n=1 Tax=Xylanimonas allomyrinae TaxID=2509459 RepID=UPI0014770E73|nr:transposase [Xylanimonas allomyrinae]